MRTSSTLNQFFQKNFGGHQITQQLGRSRKFFLGINHGAFLPPPLVNMRWLNIPCKIGLKLLHHNSDTFLQSKVAHTPAFVSGI